MWKPVKTKQKRVTCHCHVPGGSECCGHIGPGRKLWSSMLPSCRKRATRPEVENKWQRPLKMALTHQAACRHTTEVCLCMYTSAWSSVINLYTCRLWLTVDVYIFRQWYPPSLQQFSWNLSYAAYSGDVGKLHHSQQFQSHAPIGGGHFGGPLTDPHLIMQRYEYII